ncbi:MAG: glycosyltransferase 87 family protein [Micrococcales bacterium]|nr:glycosyltransferase 87 family protein [Micrococcales bacterium]
MAVVLGGILLIALGALPVVWHYLIAWPQDQWQVDVEVYRQGGESVLLGRPVYETMTEPPQLLPFTYPPFSAILSVPLALVPFRVAGWAWTIAQILATTAIVWYAGHRVIRRAGHLWPLLLGALTAPMFWLQPISDGIRFGQVNAFLVLACLMDLRRPRPRLVRRIPPGVLVGLAMSIKLVPGVFVIHYLVNRRWKEAATAIGTAVVATLGSWVILPQASFAFWGGALSDPTRLGPNKGTANQSMRGVILRSLGEGTLGTLLWLVLVAVVGFYGYRLARRAWLAGDTITEVAAVGLMAMLLSPVAWIHHLHWLVVVLFAILGADPLRDRARLIAAGGLALFFVGRVPWWGIHWIENKWPPVLVGKLLQNSDCLAALAALALLGWSLRRSLERDDGPTHLEPEAAAQPVR